VEMEEGALDNSEADQSTGHFIRPSLDESIQTGFLNRSSLEGSIQTRRLLRSSLDGSIQSGPLNGSLDVSLQSNLLSISGHLEADGILESGALDSSVTDRSLVNQSVQSGPLDCNESFPAGLLDKYLQPQLAAGDTSLSTHSVQTLSTQSVQTGYKSPNSNTEYNQITRSSNADKSNSSSNRSSISSSNPDSFQSQYSSSEEMCQVSSFPAGSTNGISSPADLENMMVEVGSLHADQITTPDLQTALANRDAVISRLSTSLNQVMQERGEDGEIARKLEEEVAELKDQVMMAVEKAAKNKEFKIKFQKIQSDNEILQQNLNVVSGQLGMKEDRLDGLEKVLEAKDKEISKFKSSKNQLMEKLQNIQNEINDKSAHDENYYKLKVLKLEEFHEKEINEMKERYELELQDMMDNHEEEQVVEMNLLDMELEKLRDEKIELADQLEVAREEIEAFINSETAKTSSDQFDNVQTEAENLVDKLAVEKALVMEKLTNIEKLYEEEKLNRESLESNYRKEKSSRESLEVDLANIGSVLDETQYQFLPKPVRESLERSVRFSIESGALSPSRRESFNLIFGDSQSYTTPPNVTQGDFEFQINDSDITPTHRPVKDLAEEAEVVTALKAEHEKEMSELRKYFENVCKELEMKYRAEIEENMKRKIPTPGWMAVGVTSGPVSLELGPAPIEFEFESMSPRSGFSSDNCAYQHYREHSGVSVTSDIESDNHNQESDKESTTFKQEEHNSVHNHTGERHARKKHEEEVTNLKAKIDDLEKLIKEIESRSKDSGLEQITKKHELKMKKVESNHKCELESAKEKVKKELEAEHLRKFSLVSNQIQSLQKSELDNLKSAMNDEHSRNIRDMNERFSQEINSLEGALKDIQESHKLEVKELEKKYKAQLNQRKENDKQKEITPDLYKSMKDDLDNLCLERDQLHSKATLMGQVISDLALHYNLSEKQVQLLSLTNMPDSTFFGQQMTTDSNALNTSVSVDDISDLLGDGNQSEEILLELRDRVRLANSTLLELGQRHTSILLKPVGEVSMQEDFVGLEAGRLEVDRARLEVELVMAQQRIQELELSGRVSLGRSDVISGCGEAGGLAVDMGEVRERANKMLSNYKEEGEGIDGEEIVSVLGELLVYSDGVSAMSKERVEDVEQQLEVADKQLKATRAFLEDQAAEREQEREEWEKKLLQMEKSKKENVERVMCEEEEGGSYVDSERGETPQQKVIELETELSSAVDKIYELREIIRNFELKLESRTQGEMQQGEVVRELRLALEEAVVGHQLVQQELELLRSSSSDAEFIEHIRGLEEQLGSKTQELKKHRAAANHIQEIRVQLRGLEERVEQSTRELEHSVCDHIGSSSTSRSSSRQSSPAPAREEDGGSYEDIGSSLSGLEVEEVSRLEKKLKYLEKAETAAVEKVKKLDLEKFDLVNKLKEFQEKTKGIEEKYAALQSELESYKAKIKEYVAREEKTKQDMKNIEAVHEKLEDLEAERELLQEKVTQQQMQISSLQSSIQTSRHRIGSGGKDDSQKLLQEKEVIRAELEQLKSGFRMQELEKIQAVKAVQLLKANVFDLETKLEAAETSDVGGNCSKCPKLVKDVAELTEVNEKLQSQVSLARAGQLAAQKTEMPLLAQKLLDEKNQEIDLLRKQLLSSNTSMSLNQVAHSTPNSLPWTSKLEESRGSVEQLRDASHLRDRLPDRLSLENQLRVNNSVKLLQSSNQKLQTIQENDGYTDSFVQISGKNDIKQVAKKLAINSSDLELSVNNLESSGGNLSATEVDSDDLTEPRHNLTGDSQTGVVGDGKENSADLENVVNTKVLEIEYMTKVLNEKDDLIENLQDNLEELEEKLENISDQGKEMAENLEKEISEKTQLKETSNNDKEVISSLNINLEEAEEKIQALEKKAFSQADQALVQEIKILREEKQDRIEGMENLHNIIENAQKLIEEKNLEIQSVKEELSQARESLSRTEFQQKELDEKFGQVYMQFNEKLEYISSLETQIETCKQFLSQSEHQKKEIEMQLIEHLAQVNFNPSVDKITQEKEILENQLGKITMEMASVQKVVTEMTLSFKNQIQLKDQELRSVKSELEKRCAELDTINNASKEKIDQLERQIEEKCQEVRKEMDSVKFLEHGSLDDLSNLVQAELDLSSELDNTLLSQVVSGLGLDSTAGSINHTGVSEVQRLVKKIQADGIKVLSLSERLFLMQHANVGQNMNIGEDKAGARDNGDGGSRERELERKLGVLEFQLEQEKVLSQDLRSALTTEKKNVLDNLSKIGKERRTKADLETQLGLVEREMEVVRSSLTQAQQQLCLKENQLHFNSDSENEEFLNTIEAQKLQIISLEESLKMEKNNFSQLQHVLEVERGRGRKDDAGGRWDEKTERRVAQLQDDLEEERGVRRNLEDSVMTDDIGRMIIQQLQRDLQYDREKLREVEMILSQERQKYSDLYTEYDHLKKNSPNISSDEVHINRRESSEFEKQLRSKNLELERYSSELEMKQDMLERELRRLKGETVRMEGQLKEEREKNLSGLNKEQLVRMKQVNTFLEHNLKENGEMLQSLARLHEEKQQMKKVNWELQDKLVQCVCMSEGGGPSQWTQPDQKTFYGKYLRAESFRKALVWQKRYLLVLLCGELVPDPVLMVVRDSKLGRNGRFRAVVHSIISISRMKFLVKRWRSGKRAGAHMSSSMAWSEALVTGRSSAAPTTGRSSTGVPSLDLSSPVDTFPPSLSAPSTARAQFVKSQSVPSYNLTSNKMSSPSPLSPRPLATSATRPRNPPTFGRSNSLRSSVPRPNTLGLRDDISLSSSNPSSSSSFQPAPAVTGNTPPTRDTVTRRSRSSAPVAPPSTNTPVRRSLGSQFRERDTTLAAVGDNTLQRDLEEYIRRFGNLQEKRNKF